MTRVIDGDGNEVPLEAQVAQLAEENRRLQRLANILLDLDRCEHGRHQGDVCSGCGGPSLGSPWQGNQTWPGRRPWAGPPILPGQIGFGIDADPVVIPHRDNKQDPAAWRPRRKRPH